MTTVKYTAMSDQELKRYILDHRHDQEAFYAYMNRRRSRPGKTAIELDDPDWENKMIALIQTQLEANSSRH